MLVHRRPYYDALEAASKGIEASDWLAWFAGIALEAQERTLSQIQFLIDKARLLDQLRGKLNDRQEKVMLRLFREGPAGFTGGLNAGKYVSIAKTSPATARRDLGELIQLPIRNRLEPVLWVFWSPALR